MRYTLRASSLVDPGFMTLRCSRLSIHQLRVPKDYYNDVGPYLPCKEPCHRWFNPRLLHEIPKVVKRYTYKT